MIRQTRGTSVLVPALALLLHGCLFSGGGGTTDADPCAQDERVDTGECVACEAGTTRAAGDDPTGADTTCDPVVCAEDERVLANACVACEEGSTRAAGDDASGADTTCVSSCDEDEFVESNTCTECAPGSTRDAGDDPTGGDTSCEVVECGEDEFVEDHACEACPAGTRRDAGDPATGNDTRCEPILCADGERVRGNECASCPAGTTNMGGDDASGPDTECDMLCPRDHKATGGMCMPCEPGTRSPGGVDPTAGDTSCEPILCMRNEAVSNNECVTCPPGTGNEEGDDASQGNTSCTPNTCPEDHRVLANQCVECAPGATRPAGDDASGENTTCDVTECAEDERVQDNACVPCAVGEERDAGDLATGEDTQCTTILCGNDEFVESNTCVPCPPGANRDGGDPATGPDTQCFDVCTAAVGITCDLFEEAYIKASNTGAGDEFGFAVAISGDTLVVGAHKEQSSGAGAMPQQDDSTNGAGAVYVFVRTGTSWSQQAYLKAPNPQNSSGFGWSVAIDGDTIVVGELFEDSNGVNPLGSPSSGAAHVFTRNATNAWANTGYLKATNIGDGDRFGHAVAISRGTIAVGAPREDGSQSGVDPVNLDDAAADSGAVYTFVSDANGTWSAESTIKAPNTGAGDEFGYAVAIDEDTLVVGARWEASADAATPGDDSRSKAGAAYVYERSTRWSLGAYLKSPAPAVDANFGLSVATSDGLVLVGCPGEIVISGGVRLSGAGVAYVFEDTPQGWVQTAALTHPDPTSADRFGESVALDEDVALVGAFGDDTRGSGLGADPTDQHTPASSTSGAVVLFDRDMPGVWSQRAFIKASNATLGNRFGYRVALDGDRIAVGDYFEDSDSTGVNGDQFDTSAVNSGAVYVRRIEP